MVTPVTPVFVINVELFLNFRNTAFEEALIWIDINILTLDCGECLFRVAVVNFFGWLLNTARSWCHISPRRHRRRITIGLRWAFGA